MSNGIRKLGFLILILSTGLGACAQSARKLKNEPDAAPQMGSLSPIPYENQQRESSYEFTDASITGPGGTKPKYVSGEVITDNILRVTIVPNKIYTDSTRTREKVISCTRYRVGIEGTSYSVLTPYMATNGGGYCPGAGPDSGPIDMSVFLGVGRNQSVKINVTELSHNDWCISWNQYRNYYGDYWANYYVGNYDTVCTTKSALPVQLGTFTVRVTANGTL